MSGYVICQICESYHDSIEELNAHYERDHPTGNTLSKSEKTKDGKYKCDYCNKLFNQPSNLYEHQRRLHGREPGQKRKQNQGDFECEFCEKRLSTKQRLRHHIKQVHGTT